MTMIEGVTDLKFIPLLDSLIQNLVKFGFLKKDCLLGYVTATKTEATGKEMVQLELLKSPDVIFWRILYALT